MIRGYQENYRCILSFLTSILLITAAAIPLYSSENRPPRQESSLEASQDTDETIIQTSRRTVREIFKVRESKKSLFDRMQWFYNQRKGPDGFIPPGARRNAFRQLDTNLQNGLLRPSPMALPGNIWTSIGPAPLYDSGVAYTGRVSAIATHPTDINTVYIGGATGGVWKTIDGGVTWQPLTDTETSLAIGAITIDPNDPTGNTIYVGTGESHFSCDSHFGDGILKSIDGGLTWINLGQSTFVDTSISKIIVNPMNPMEIFVSNTYGSGGFICWAKWVNCGVWRSSDGGMIWSRIFGPAQTGTGTNPYVTDLVMDFSNPNILYAGVNDYGVWKTINGGASWAQCTTGLPASSAISRVELAIDQGNPATLYTVMEDAGTWGQQGTYKTVNGGTNWSSLTKPTGSCQGWTLTDICTYTGTPWGTCWYNLYIEVDTSGGVWLGGIGLWYSGNGGTSWSSVCPTSVHVDQHAMASDAGGPAGFTWIGNDGGVFKTADNGSSWTNLNAGLALTQFYPGASLHPTNPNVALAGSQDNGTNIYTGVPTNWTLLTGGDGAWTAIDFSNPDNAWFTSSQYLAIYYTPDGGGSWFNRVTGLDTTNASFIAPFEMCPHNNNVMVAGTDNVWLSTNNAVTWGSNSPDPIDSSGTLYNIIRSITFDPSDLTCSTYYVGMENGKIFRTLNQGGAWTDITGGLPGLYWGVSDIAVDPTNSNYAFVALSGYGVPHIFRTTNALAAAPTWTPTDPGIPDTPANALLIDPTDPAAIYLGNDLGVFRSVDGGFNWQYFMAGHPVVPVHDIVASQLTGTIVSFTHGRGAFRLDMSAPGEAAKGQSNHLKLSKSSGNLVFNWGAPGGTCYTQDYAIYKGDLNILTQTQTYDHNTQVRCFETNTTYSTPLVNDGIPWYYLVVSSDSTSEGSYGFDSASSERPQSTNSCTPPPQNLMVCN